LRVIIDQRDLRELLGVLDRDAWIIPALPQLLNAGYFPV
jgi:hypothetical protein